MSRHLALQDPEALKPADWAIKYLLWLCIRHSVGALIALGAALSAFRSPAAPGFAAFSLHRAVAAGPVDSSPP